MNDNIKQQLQTIPLLKTAKIKHITAVKQGQTNRLFKLQLHSGETWGVRLNRPQTLGVDRPFEAQILQQVQHLEFTPNIIANHPQQGYLIYHWIDGKSWSQQDLQNPKKLSILRQNLEQIHHLECHHQKLRLDNRLLEYLKQIPFKNQLKQLISNNINKLKQNHFWQPQNQLTHFDLNPTNIIGEQAAIIDWEFAGCGHPILDWLIIQHYAQTKIDHPKHPNQATIQQLIEQMLQIWQT